VVILSGEESVGIHDGAEDPRGGADQWGFSLPVTAIVPDVKGKIFLSPGSADLMAASRSRNEGGQPTFGFWTTPRTQSIGPVRFPAARKYKVQTAAASPNGDRLLRR